MKTPMPNNPKQNSLRRVGVAERYTLERNGCSAADWHEIYIDRACDLDRIRNVHFEGRVEIGAVERLQDAVIEDCRIGNRVHVNGVRGRLKGVSVGSGAVIENVGSIEVEPETTYGLGTAVNVLDETGSRPVYLFPGLSAQVAALMALRPRWAEDTLLPALQEKWIESKAFDYDIADEAVVSGCGQLLNVHVGRRVRINGASRLVNGVIINNAAAGKELAGIDGQVDGENFIIEDGFCGGASLLRNVYIGQGASVDKRFTAHDSVFFANCGMENGEGVALMAGPYSVSMHKSSLLIGARTAFFNAGSATNFSNHMYKLGPVHWGVLERGVKTSSGSYIMWGGRVGAFSLVMGVHKHHPDTSAFPFSYLFATGDGHTLVAPALMLKSCGLQRDGQKWPMRDRRLKRGLPLYDNICHEVLNPVTVQSMLRALPLLRQIAGMEAGADGTVDYGSLRMRPSAALRGIRLYTLAVTVYLYRKMHTEGYELTDASQAPAEWIDLQGQIMPRTTLEDALTAGESDRTPQQVFDQAFREYKQLELNWVRSLAEGIWAENMKTAPQAVVEFESLIEQDRSSYMESLSHEAALGTF